MANLDENKKLEVIHEAINIIIEHRNKKDEDRGEDDEQETLLLSKSLSQLDVLEKDAKTTSNLLKCPVEKEEPLALASNAIDSEAKGMGLVEIARELKRVRRQNVITHCLLTVMIVVTTVWQFSEASLLINMKKTVTHPIKSVGDMIVNSLKRKGKKPKITAHPLHPVSVPEFPHLHLQYLPLEDGEE